MSLTEIDTVPVDPEGRAWGSAERPVKGLLDGWAPCPDCDHVARVMYGQPFECTECGYTVEGDR